MSRSRATVEIAAVASAEHADLSQAIEGFRDYLLLVAERALAPDLKGKEGASDLVQEALLEAHRDLGRYTGGTERELQAWLRRLLLHKVAHVARWYRGTNKRRMDREVSLSAVQPGGNPSDFLVADHTSPGGRASKREEETALVAALGRLPQRMRQVVLWRHHEDCSFDEIGRRLGLSNVSARNLWLGGLQQLQIELKALDDDRSLAD